MPISQINYFSFAHGIQPKWIESRKKKQQIHLPTADGLRIPKTVMINQVRIFHIVTEVRVYTGMIVEFRISVGSSFSSPLHIYIYVFIA